MSSLRSALVGGLAALTLSATAAFAGPTYTFTSSAGTQPSNVGTITLSQVNANSVRIVVDLASGYGFLNTGGPHTPFAWNMNVPDAALGITYATPNEWTFAGTPGCASTSWFIVTYCTSNFSLNTAGGSNTPYGTYTTALDWSEGNGSGNAYYGDLDFTLTLAGGLSTDNFISNGSGYFSADLTNGNNTGAQAWNLRTGGTTTTAVPEPLTLSLFGAGLAGAFVARRRRAKA